MNQHLNGIYKISFNIEIKDTDYLDQSDLTFLLTEGVGEKLANKVANLEIEKLDKNGQKISKVIKVGDKVQLKENIILRANFYEDDGYLFIGNPTDISIEIGSKEITLEAGSLGYVNQIHKNGEIDIIDLDHSVKVSLRVDDLGTEIEDDVNVDFITVKAEQLEKVENQEDK